MQVLGVQFVELEAGIGKKQALDWEAVETRVQGKDLGKRGKLKEEESQAQ